MTAPDLMPGRLAALRARMAVADARRAARKELSATEAAVAAERDAVWPFLAPMAARQARRKTAPRFPLPPWVMERYEREGV